MLIFPSFRNVNNLCDLLPIGLRKASKENKVDAHKLLFIRKKNSLLKICIIMHLVLLLLVGFVLHEVVHTEFDALQKGQYLTDVPKNTQAQDFSQEISHRRQNTKGKTRSSCASD